MACLLEIESTRNDGVKGSGLVEAREREGPEARPGLQLLLQDRLDEENGSGIRRRLLKTSLKSTFQVGRLGGLVG